MSSGSLTPPNCSQTPTTSYLASTLTHGRHMATLPQHMNAHTISSTPMGSCSPPVCSGCKKSICERFLLKAMDQFWHEDCLKCSCCDCRLGEVGSTLFTRANLILCKRDYLRLFGSTGTCSACKQTIPAFVMVMRAKGNNYHLECFACHRCNHRFCVGDKFYLLDNRVVCEYDYVEECKPRINSMQSPTTMPQMMPNNVHRQQINNIL